MDYIHATDQCKDDTHDSPGAHCTKKVAPIHQPLLDSFLPQSEKPTIKHTTFRAPVLFFYP